MLQTICYKLYATNYILQTICYKHWSEVNYVGALSEQLHYNSTTTPLQLHYNSNTTPLQLHYNSTTTPLQLHCNSTTTPQLHYNSTTTPLQLHYNSTTTPLQLHYNSTTTPLQLHYNSTTDPLQLHYNSTTTPLQLHYNSTTTPLQLHYNYTTTPLQLHYNSTTTPIQLHYNSTTTSLQLHHNSTTTHSTTTPLQLHNNSTTTALILHYNSTTTPLQIHYNSTKTPLQLHYNTTTIKRNFEQCLCRNVAVRQNVTLSSEHPLFPAGKAVDGNDDRIFQNGSCSQTRFLTTASPEQHFTLTFKRKVNIRRFILFNAKNSEYSLSEFYLEAYETIGGRVVHRFEDIPKLKKVSFYNWTIKAVAAQQVRIHIRKQQLIICEFQVFGDYECGGQRYGLECEKMCKCSGRCAPSTGSCLNGTDYSKNRLRCGDVPVVLYGSWMQCSHHVNSVCMLVCDRGYSVEGNETITCQGDATWTAPGVCTILKCSSAALVPHGKWIFCRHRECQLKCNKGFTLEGNTHITCQDNLQWTAPGRCIHTSNSCDEPWYGPNCYYKNLFYLASAVYPQDLRVNSSCFLTDVLDIKFDAETTLFHSG
ncbi:uncharacterized protein LOC131941485 [Physella acuta]|uniref:uncharacterized protein LOC131941485 n=1 Tax=Physella acuta TaxID=109671 RepID=UPI0027DDFD3C|nr:uncharacterized protein LOC131941485 [Physella acuta]